MLKGGGRPLRPIESPGPRRRSPMPTIEARLSRRAFMASGLPTRILTTFPAPHQSKPGPPPREPPMRTDSPLTPLVSVSPLRDPANQPKLVALLQEGVELYSKRQEGGMIATVFLTSRDGTRVIGYSQWRDAAA